MEMFSAPADVVLDPFVGKGEVLRLNRTFIGIDIDPDYVEIAKGRLR